MDKKTIVVDSRDPLLSLEEIGIQAKSCLCYFSVETILKMISTYSDYDTFGGYLRVYRRLDKPADISFLIDKGVKKENIKNYLNHKEWLLAYSSFSNRIGFNHRPDNPEMELYFVTK